MDGDFSMLNSQDLLTKDVDELKRTVKKRRVDAEKEREKESKREKRDEKNNGAGAFPSPLSLVPPVPSPPLPRPPTPWPIP